MLFRTEFLKQVNAGGVNPARNVQYVANYTCRDVNFGERNSSHNIQFFRSWSYRYRTPGQGNEMGDHEGYACAMF